MKKLVCFAITASLALSVSAQKTDASKALPDATKKIEVVEASCGVCKFGMKNDDCALAVKIDGKKYFVDGTSIGAFGDAHAKDGFCNEVRKAEVQGEIVDNRFKATYFKLLPVKKP